MAKAFGYKVVQLHEGVIGGKMSGDKLEKVLNEHGRQGWQLKSVTAVEVKERLGPGWGRGGSRDIRTDDGLTATRRFGAPERRRTDARCGARGPAPRVPISQVPVVTSLRS